jgi:LPXTG-motif cell wall-anchored protein
MKNLKSLLIVLVSMVAFVLAFSLKGVYATESLVLNPGTSGTATSNTATSNTTTTNSVANTTTNNTTNTTRLNTTNTANTATTNNINSNVEKDLPKTGETDTYIIAGIGAVALVIGSIAFIKSRNM